VPGKHTRSWSLALTRTTGLLALALLLLLSPGKLSASGATWPAALPVQNSPARAITPAVYADIRAEVRVDAFGRLDVDLAGVLTSKTTQRVTVDLFTGRPGQWTVQGLSPTPQQTPGQEPGGIRPPTIQVVAPEDGYRVTGYVDPGDTQSFGVWYSLAPAVIERGDRYNTGSKLLRTFIRLPIFTEPEDGSVSIRHIDVMVDFPLRVGVHPELPG